MLNCDKFKMQFSEYLDNELPLSQRKEVDDHLAVCVECSEILRQIKIVQQSLRQLPRVSASPEFEKKLHEQIFLNPSKPNIFPLPLQNWKIPAMGTALVAATVSFFLILYQSPNDNREVSPAVPSISSQQLSKIPNPPYHQTTSSDERQNSLINDSLKTDSSAQSHFGGGEKLIND
jgi:hypothetical protein